MEEHDGNVGINMKEESDLSWKISYDHLVEPPFTNHYTCNRIWSNLASLSFRSAVIITHDLYLSRNYMLSHVTWIYSHKITCLVT